MFIKDHTAPRRLGLGPRKWCKKCSRYHRARATCDLYIVRRPLPTKDGGIRWTTRLAHRYAGAPE